LVVVEEDEQGMLLSIVDLVTDKDTNVSIDMKDFGGRLFGRSLGLLQGKVNITLGTLKAPKEDS